MKPQKQYQIANTRYIKHIKKGLSDTLCPKCLSG